MPDMQQLAERYIAIWNDTDPTGRRTAIEETYAADARYVDPQADVVGHDGIDALIGGAQERFAGLRFRLAGPVDAHHDVARFGWELGPDGGEAVVVGFDVAEATADGRLAGVVGFLDRVPG